MAVRGQTLKPLPSDVLGKIRAEIEALTDLWNKVAPYQVLVLELPA